MTEFIAEDGGRPSTDAGQAVQDKGKTSGRLIILGFDGLDMRQVDRLMRRGQMPNLQRLGGKGHKGLLQTTNPPQSPVAWAAFATGAPAGEHGIFDFIGRDPQTYLPKIATTLIEPAQIANQNVTVAKAENLRHGASFWDVIADAGVPTYALQIPYAYPPPAQGGARQLTGLGTPDVRATNSTFTFLTSNKATSEQNPAGGQMEYLEPLHGMTNEQQAWRAHLQGPRVSVEGVMMAPWVPVSVERIPNSPTLHVDVGGHAVELKLHETSAYLPVAFAVSPNFTIAATTRLTLRTLQPDVEIYAEPLSMVPTKAYLPVSQPPQVAMDLWEHLGAYKTVGWLDDTSGFEADVMDGNQFIAEAMAHMAWQKARLLETLEAHTDKLVLAAMTAPDRLAHMFFRATDRRSRFRFLAKNFEDAIDASYRACDEIVGEVVQKMDASDVLLVMSDHGFEGFRRGFNVNRWLIQHGYMVLKPNVKIGRPFFQDVDWSKTRAYALGTGSIFLNLQGREGAGIVSVEQAPKLTKQIAQRLTQAMDGTVFAVAAAYIGTEVYQGSQQSHAPDIRVALKDGYRVSWGTSLGGAAPTLFEDNTQKWSGDHASARPEDVPGILFSNRPIGVATPHIEDIAATAYRWTGVVAPSTVVGNPLF